MDTENPRPEALSQPPLPHTSVEPRKTQSRTKAKATPVRTCSKCHKTFPATPEYFFRKLTGLQGKCKTCAHAESLAYQRAHKETINARHREKAAPKVAERQRQRTLLRTAPEKACTVCRQMLPRTKEFFPVNALKYDGFEARCRPCYRKRWQRNPVDPVIQRQRINESNCRLKEEMIAAYGGCCACCGERQIDFLTIDHTRGDGAAHRRALGGASYVYRFLRKNGFPRDGYRILCWNCNHAVKDGLPCPHQETNPLTRNIPPLGKSDAAASNRRLRNETLAAYGHRCACCGEENARFLTIEHLVKTWTGKRPFHTQGAHLCRALKRQGFPKEGYTLLCFSCNCTSRYGKPCPHRTRPLTRGSSQVPTKKQKAQ